MRFRMTTMLAGAALALAACGEESTTAPAATAARPELAAAGGGSSGHIFTFGGRGVPSDFAARVAARGGTLTHAFAPIGVAAASGLSDADAAALASASGANKVEPDYTVVLEDVTLDPAGAEAAAPGPDSPSNPAAASRYNRQWNMRAIGADLGWAAGRLGSSSVKVAILDTGLDYTYPDLAGRVDLSLSKSFVPSDDALIAASLPGVHPIADLHFHGTHVGATVVSNSNIVAGVTSGVTLFGVKVLGASGSGSTSGVLAGIIYAADAGADVINMSLGSTFNKRDFPGFISLVHRATNYAASKGVTVVVSAGNAAADLDHDKDGYKSYCNAPTVICVAATGPTAQASVTGPWTNVDAPSSYTNYGRSSISVAAPGGNAASFVWSACSRFSRQIPVCRTGIFILGAQGTSMASPHVAGLAALLVEDLGRSPGAIRERLQDTADDLGQSGTDPYYGKGRISVPGALGL